MLPTQPSPCACQLSSLGDYLDFQLFPLPACAPWVLPKRPPLWPCVLHLWKGGMVFTSSLATSSPDVSAEGRAWCCPFLRTSWQVLGHQQTQASEPEQQMWQQDAKPAAPSGPEHSQPEAAPGGSGFSTDKQHIKVAAPATASPWGLAQMGQPCLSVVFCSLCLLQPLPASAFVFLQGHPPNIVLRLLVLYCPPDPIPLSPTAPQAARSAWWQRD